MVQVQYGCTARFSQSGTHDFDVQKNAYYSTPFLTPFVLRIRYCCNTFVCVRDERVSAIVIRRRPGDDRTGTVRVRRAIDDYSVHARISVYLFYVLLLLTGENLCANYNTREWYYFVYNKLLNWYWIQELKKKKIES